MCRFLVRVVCGAVVIGMFTLVLSGCYDSREMEDTGFILAAGFEPAEGASDGIKLTVQVAVPAKMAGEGGGGGGGGGGGDSPVWSASATARTVLEAVREIQRRSATNLFWSHAYAVLISEELARKGIKDLVGFLTMEPEIRPTTRVFVVRGDIEKVMGVQSPQQPVSANYLMSLARWQIGEGMLPDVRVHELAIMLSDRGRQAYVPVISPYEPRPAQDEKTPQVGPPGAAGGEGRNEEPSRMEQAAKEAELPSGKEGEEGRGEGRDGEGEGGSKAEKATELSAGGIAVFRGDKMVGILNDEESRGLMWLLGRGKGAAFGVKTEHLKGEVVLRTLSSGVDKKVVERHDSPEKCRFLVKTTLEVVIAELNTSEKFMDRDSIGELEKHAALTVEKEIRAALKAAQETHGSDFVGFGEVFRRSVPLRRWEEIGPTWLEVFPRVKVDTMVTVKIRRRGMTLFRVKPAV